MLCRAKKKKEKKKDSSDFEVDMLRRKHGAAKLAFKHWDGQSKTHAHTTAWKHPFLNLYAFGCHESLKNVAVHERINVYKENDLLQPEGPGGLQCTATTQQQNVDS